MSSSTLAVPSEFIEVYVSVLSIIAVKCQTIDPSQTELKGACDALKTGIRHLKTFAAPLNAILPSEQDLSPLKSIDTYIDSNEELWQEEWKTTIERGSRLLTQVLKLHPKTFPDDVIKGGIFSPLRLAQLGEQPKSGATKGLTPWLLGTDLQYNILAQVRAARAQMAEYYAILKWVLAATLIPQLLLLLALCLNCFIGRRRQTKLRKKLKKAEQSRELLGRMRFAALREQGRLVELNE